jgi:hypothetical protein
MGEETIVDLVSQAVGRICKMETMEGSVRTERVLSVSFHEIRWGDEIVSLPKVLYFDATQNDGIDLAILRNIEILG